LKNYKILHQRRQEKVKQRGREEEKIFDVLTLMGGKRFKKTILNWSNDGGEDITSCFTIWSQNGDDPWEQMQ